MHSATKDLFPRPEKAQLIAVLQSHIGKANGISGHQIAFILGCAERVVRQLITEAREDGTAVCGHPATGYFIAETQAEIDETIAFLRARALHSLTLAAKLGDQAVADLIGQLRLPT